MLKMSSVVHMRLEPCLKKLIRLNRVFIPIIAKTEGSVVFLFFFFQRKAVLAILQTGCERPRHPDPH